MILDLVLAWENLLWWLVAIFFIGFGLLCLATMASGLRDAFRPGLIENQWSVSVYLGLAGFLIALACFVALDPLGFWPLEPRELPAVRTLAFVFLFSLSFLVGFLPIIIIGKLVILTASLLVGRRPVEETTRYCPGHFKDRRGCAFPGDYDSGEG